MRAAGGRGAALVARPSGDAAALTAGVLAPLLGLAAAAAAPDVRAAAQQLLVRRLAPLQAHPADTWLWLQALPAPAPPPAPQAAAGQLGALVRFLAEAVAAVARRPQEWWQLGQTLAPDPRVRGVRPPPPPVPPTTAIFLPPFFLALHAFLGLPPALAVLCSPPPAHTSPLLPFD